MRFDYLLKRLLLAFPVVLGVSLLVFIMIHLIPGDPALLILGDSAQPADVEKLRHDLGLDLPLSDQLVKYYKGLATFDLGNSLHKNIKVTEIISQRFPATLELTIISLICAILIAVPFGILSAVRANSSIDRVSMFFALIGVSMPHFWMGPMLILTFSLHLKLLPISGRSDLSSYILPALTLGSALSAILARMIRSSLLEVIRAQYVLTARAKGLHPLIVILKHALKNSMIPVVTILGLQFGSLLGGSIITETIFSWPGIGRELIQAIQGRDYPVVQGCVLTISFCYVFINIMTDILYAWIDPRIKYSADIAPVAWNHYRLIKSIRSKFLRVFMIFCVAFALYVTIRFHSDKIHGIQQYLIELKSVILRSHYLEGFFRNLVCFVKMSILAFPVWALWKWRLKEAKQFRKFSRRLTSIFGIITLYFFLVLGLFGRDFVRYEPLEQNLGNRLALPNADHIFGTDDMGRDLFGRMVHGTFISMYVAVSVTFICAVSGVCIGLICGFWGGWIDEIIMRIIDILLAFPGILLAIALVAVMGPNINNVILALCLMGWVGYARLARAQVLSVREEEFVSAARSLGSSQARIVLRHILPNILAPLIIQATLGMAGIIVAEAGLSFLGLGVQPPTPSWGTILNSGIDYFRKGPHMSIIPGLAIMTVVMALNFLGDSLRDALDPKLSS